ncbi:MAG: DUF4433 domain-containing protein [Bacteroidales bacterium]|jgi:hypothetical protein|nr:DUF4433 domain-containing protein [Bacteroidales bacterium]
MNEIINLTAQQKKALLPVLLDRFGIEYLYYMTHIDNISSIYELGILCYNKVSDIKHINISNMKVQRRRDHIPGTKRYIHDYVPLYFAHHTPMQYVISTPSSQRNRPQTICEDDLIFILVDAEKTFNTKGIFFTDGNAACDETSFYNSLLNLSVLNWDVIYSDHRRAKWWEEDYRREKSSEVLVPHRIPKKHIVKIVTRTIDAANKIEENSGFDCEVNEGFYYNNGL